MDKYAQVNGIQLHYLDHPGGDPPIILLPGLTAHAQSFNGLFEAGLSPRFRVLAVDLRGRGLSDKPAAGYSMADHAADIIGLMDLLGLEKAVLGGHSFGGWLAFYIAANFPERVSKMVIIDVAHTVHPRTRELIQPALDRLDKVYPSLDDFLGQMKQMPFLHGWWDDAIDDYYRTGVEVLEDGSVKSLTRAEAIAESAEKAVTEPWEEYVTAIQHPAILLNAPAPFGPPGAPAVLPEENARATAELMPNCTYIKMPGNHLTLVFGDNAPWVVDAITKFLAD